MAQSLNQLVFSVVSNPVFRFFGRSLIHFVVHSSQLSLYFSIRRRAPPGEKKERRKAYVDISQDKRKKNKQKFSVDMPFFFAFVFRFRRSIPSCLSFYRTFYPVLYHSVLCSRRSVLPSLSLYHLSKSSGPHLVSVQVELIIAL